MNLYSFFRKKHSKPFLGAVFAAIFLSAFFVTSSKSFAQVTPRPISDYLTLWGTDTTTPQKDDITTAKKSGIAYFGPKPQSAGGIGADGTLKKISVPITLLIDQTKYREWNMVGSDYFESVDGGIFGIGSNNKYYLRLLDQSFIARIYQKDDSGNVINESVSLIKICSFYDCSNSKNSSPNADILINSGKPLDHISKFRKGSSMFGNFWNPYSDGYADNNGDDIKQSGQDGFVTATKYTTPGLYVLGKTLNYLIDTDGPALILGQTAIVDLDINKPLEKGKDAYIELWYMGSSRLSTNKSDNGPAPFEANNSRVKYFNIPIQNGFDNTKYPFFQIGGTYTFKTPASLDEANTAAQNAIAEASTVGGNMSDTDNTQADTLPVCVLAHPLTGSGSFMGCIAYIGYGVYQITAWIAGILGKAMDFFLGYSISDESYRASVIVTGWKLVRDISNIFFIIILIWTGFATVFNMDGISMKKVVPSLIINALIINFSLFGTQLVIDISNITARLFYNTMSVCDGKCIYKAPPHEKEIANPNTRGTGGYKPLSEKIVDSFDPQRIFKAQTLSATPNKDTGTDNTSTNGGFNASGISNNIDATASKTLNIYDSDYAIYFLIVSIIAAMIMLGMAKMFFGVMFMFVGRVVGLYMSMIFSPFAVLTRGNMPIVSKIKELSWGSWLEDLTNYALLAPIFIFFLYIIYAFINSDMLSIVGLKEDGGFMNTVIAICIPMIIVYMLVGQGVKIAKKYAGAAGEMIQKYATQATGLVAGAAVGVASGGLAFAGTRVAGLAKLTEARRAELTAKKAEGGFAGRMASLRLGMNDRAQSGSFDMRKTKAFGGLNSFTKDLGFSLNDKVSSNIGLGQDATKGGMKAIEKKEKEDMKKKIESIKTDLKDKDVAAVWEKKAAKLRDAEEKRLRKNEEYLIQAHRDNGKSDAEIQAMKTNNTLQDSAADLAKKKIDDDYGKVETNKQLTQALRQEFAQSIADGKTFGQQISKPLAGGGALYAANTARFATTAGATAAGVPLLAMAYDQNRKSKVKKGAASKWVDDAKKDRKKHKVPKDERLEYEKKNLETQLGEMDNYIESINSDLKSNFEKIIAAAEAGNVMFKRFKGRTADSFGQEPGDREVATEMHREAVTEDINDHNIEIGKLRERMKQEKEANNTTAAANTDREIKAKMASKKTREWELKQMDEKRRANLTSELSKKEDALDKIAEKKKKDEESGK